MVVSDALTRSSFTNGRYTPSPQTVKANVCFVFCLIGAYFRLSAPPSTHRGLLNLALN